MKIVGQRPGNTIISEQSDMGLEVDMCTKSLLPPVLVSTTRKKLLVTSLKEEAGPVLGHLLADQLHGWRWASC